MVRTIIDSPRLAARLEKRGVAPAQAEAIAKAFSEELGEELAGDARPESRALEDPERRGTLIGEVRLLKWVVGLAFLVLASVFYALYHFQYLTFEKASLDVANQAAARVQIEAVKETITTLDKGTRTRIDTLETNTRQHITALDASTQVRIDALETGTQQRFDALETSTRLQIARSEASTNERITSLAARTDERFKAVDQRFDHVDQRFDTIEGLLRELLLTQRREVGSPPSG